MQIAAAFAQVGAESIPVIEEYMRESMEPREVSYGCRVRFWTDKQDRLRAQLIPVSPKLPTVELEKYEFTLKWNHNQLQFDFAGLPPEPAEPAGTSSATPQEGAVADDAAAISRPGNGSDPDPAEKLPPLPKMVGRCPSVMATGEHTWRPLDDAPGIVFCMCGARGTTNQQQGDNA